ncbi:MAG: nucleoside-diphosphate kinase [Nanoarchaeota archaeon]
MTEQTLVLVKPDGVARGLIGEIISRFEQRGLKLIGLKFIWVDKKHASEHYDVHKDKPFFKGLVEFLTAGPVVAMVLEGVAAIEVVRKLTGSTYPNESAPGTIRGDFAHVSKEYANRKNKTVANLIHASDSKESAEKEIALWFSSDELINYKRSEDDFMI